MADVLRIKRRTTGAPGAPSGLANAELAYNEVDHTLYYGEGTGGAGGTATVVVPIGGLGVGGAIASNANPIMDGTAAPGVATLLTRGDHVHPSDTSRAPIASPTFTGVPAAPTAAPATNTTQLATTAFVAAAVTAGSAGVASFNTRTGAVVQLLADITGVGGAPIASPTFTGIPAAPTPANGTNTTQLATTQYVMGQRLDQFVAPNVDVTWNSHKITGLLDPTNLQDAATKNYVDLLSQGINAKQSVRAATVGAIGALSGLVAIDGYTLVAGDRVLVKDQAAQATNGIYIAAAGAWARSLDMNAWTEVVSAYAFVEQGTVNADSGWLCTADQGGTLGTTAIPWVQFSGAGQITAGAGLTKTGNQIDVVGTAARILVNADNIDIAATYIGQASITTLGTVTTGVWNGSTVGVPYGGTGSSLLAGYVVGNGVSAMTAVSSIPITDISGRGTMALQNANAVAITGGTIDGITFDMGTF
jgi:hypothetical protein